MRDIGVPVAGAGSSLVAYNLLTNADCCVMFNGFNLCSTFTFHPCPLTALTYLLTHTDNKPIGCLVLLYSLRSTHKGLRKAGEREGSQRQNNVSPWHQGTVNLQCFSPSLSFWPCCTRQRGTTLARYYTNQGCRGLHRLWAGSVTTATLKRLLWLHHSTPWGQSIIYALRSAPQDAQGLLLLQHLTWLCHSTDDFLLLGALMTVSYICSFRVAARSARSSLHVFVHFKMAHSHKEHLVWVVTAVILWVLHGGCCCHWTHSSNVDINMFRDNLLFALRTEPLQMVPVLIPAIPFFSAH